MARSGRDIDQAVQRDKLQLFVILHIAGNGHAGSLLQFHAQCASVVEPAALRTDTFQFAEQATASSRLPDFPSA